MFDVQSSVFSVLLVLLCFDYDMVFAVVVFAFWLQVLGFSKLCGNNKIHQAEVVLV